MSRRLNRYGLLLVCMIASEVWALGLGDIQLDSALNEPLQAEIELLSATQEELDNLRITLASAEAFNRYGIDRPIYLTRLVFSIEGRGPNSVVRVTSQEPITEPFVTFLVEAVWSRGRLLREYTVLLDPPTFAPPPSTPVTEAVAAPRQVTETDRGRIERPRAPAPSAAPAPSRPAPRTPPRETVPTPAPAASSFDTSRGGDYQVRRGDTLWRIAEEVRPDARLTMNQTMLAIYEANPRAFSGNINVLRANARLSIPSADEIFRISRGSALSEIRKQNQTWRGETPSAPQPTLTLVPPDTEQTPYDGRSTTDSEAETSSSVTAAPANQDRIRQLEEQVASQESLLEIRDSELARLRSELQRLRDERAARTGADVATTPPVVDEEPAADDIFMDDSAADVADDAAVADQAVTTPDVEATPPAPRVSSTPPAEEEGIVGSILNFLTGIWGMIGIGLLALLGVLLWFARRASGTSDDAEDTGTWEALGGGDETDPESVASTQRLRALAREDDSSIVVVEQPGGDTATGERAELTESDADAATMVHARPSAPVEAAEPVSLEDTFSSETAINLDQADPIAEADFHMAYGLYDQAADLMNGALSIEPERTDLMAKLCEIYFVWGNRESFVDAASKLKATLGDGQSGEWDKIVIMGQQIATDEPMFAEAAQGAVSATAVDLDFEPPAGTASDLDIDFASADELDPEDNESSRIIDLGAEEPMDTAASNEGEMLDFDLNDDFDASASATREMSTNDDDDSDDVTAESPTIEQLSPNLDATSELPVATGISERLSELTDGDASDATAEINLDDLGLDIDSLSGSGDEALEATGETQVLPEEIGDDDATVLSSGIGDAVNPDFNFAATEALPSDALDDDSLEPTAETPNLAATEMELDIDDLTAALKLSDAGDTVEQRRDDGTVEMSPDGAPEEVREARTMTEVGTKLDLARAYVDMGDPGGARNILEEVIEEGDDAQRQEAQQLLDSLPS